MTAPGDADTIVVGVLYPAFYFGDDDAWAAERAAIEAIDPRIEVLIEEYSETHELRTVRGGPDAASVRDRTPPVTDAHRAVLERVDVVIAVDLPFDIGAIAPNLRWVQAVGAGTAELQSAGVAEAGIRLTSGAGVNAIGIAEFVIAWLLQHWKRLPELEALQARHEWDPLYGHQLAGSTLGLLGLGAINGAVARRVQAFDVHVLATRRSATPGATAPDVDAAFPTSELHAMLGRCDAVVSAVPETAETVGLMDRAAFEAMRPGAFFCNVGRGSLVDELALVDALTSGHLRGAAIDVASVEPLPPDHPLWDVPNLHISPHAATSVAAMFVNVQQLFRDNLRRYLEGEPLINEVDVSRGY